MPGSSNYEQAIPDSYQAQAEPETKTTKKRQARYLHTGTASYYGDKFHGRRTASGERFDQNAFTSAHGSLPFGSKVRVTNLRNNKSVEVKINDRGGFHKYGRIIDLSKAAAQRIGMMGTGTAKVKVEVLE
ncbi:septal ring lytic transglycosylase RlpA family protein [Candidatus Thiothrix anitrata]|uniref:Endolytic peptidoglycan transglycosylase RlpA n=1 Tax=Candidatus Thiothrix anitrata TaxID=2823902 RepID=A0ABX7X495_9GAMM|nr:septal ring lytic transglycosylase RlpA family protein [Candidatus Thiothrix anitrata]QTR50690.1 septal ring lytic transglycosylase RlpA family protein [Candidatus Thiothrix anitrata]